MDIIRLKQILRFSSENRVLMESKIKDFFSLARMEGDRDVLNLMQIARPLFWTKYYYILEIPLRDKEIGALCYKGDAIGYTFLNTSLPKVNVNFALCHEIYHIFYQETEFKQKVEFLNEHYYEYEDEFAANLFAGMLLMPELSFRRMFDKFLAETEDKNEILPVLVRLMSYFEVPYMAALIRCYELNLLKCGDTLEGLLQVNNESIRKEFERLWLDESILEASKKDDYAKLEYLVREVGKSYQDEFINERTVQKALQNMRILYEQIKGE